MCIFIHRAIGDQAEIWCQLREHLKAELGMHAAAGLEHNQHSLQFAFCAVQYSVHIMCTAVCIRH